MRDAVECFHLVDRDQCERCVSIVGVGDDIVEKAEIIIYCSARDAGGLVRVDNGVQYRCEASG